jgi:MtN3 and saliva related transmembrane protein
MIQEVLSVLTAILGVLMSAGHFVQAYRIWQRKSGKDISLTTYGIFWVGAFVWLAYGISLGEWPIIISFIIAVLGTSTVLFLTFKYR